MRRADPALRAPARRAAGPKDRVALVDLDGTVADFDRGIQEAFAKTFVGFDDALLPEAVRDRVELLIKQQPGFWRNLPPIELGLKIACQLEKLGYRIMVLSKGPVRSTNAWTEKVEWCRQWLPFADVTITFDKGLVYGRVLVDDFPEYILRWLEWRPRGVVLMPRRPCNAGFKHPNVHEVAEDGDLERLLPLLKRRLGD